MGFDESKIKRHPKGSGEQGGQFAEKPDAVQEQQKGPVDPNAPTSGLKFDKEKKQWVNKRGEPIDEETALRLKKIGASAGYKSVSLNPDPNAALQAWVVQQNGQVKRLYSKEHQEKAAAEKFARLRDFNQSLPEISAGIERAMTDKSLSPKERDAAAALRVIEKTGLRPGGEEQRGEMRTYGVTTMLGSHITVTSRGAISIEFMGKSGIMNSRTFNDPKLAKFISQKNLVGNQRVFSVQDDDLRDFLKRTSGRPFKVKDFRTWQGTSIALREIAKMPRPLDMKSAKNARQLVAKKVAEFLNNTPAVALTNYIDPHVFDAWGR